MSETIKHIVLFKVRPEVEMSDFIQLMDEISALQESHTGILGFEHGPNETPEDRDQGYNYGFTLTLDSWDALAAYQSDPSHQATGKKLVAASQQDHSGILVFDYAIAT